MEHPSAIDFIRGERIRLQKVQHKPDQTSRIHVCHMMVYDLDDYINPVKAAQKASPTELQKPETVAMRFRAFCANKIDTGNAPYDLVTLG